MCDCCSGCGKHGSDKKKLTVRETLSAIFFVYIFPFGAFLTGIALGLKLFSGTAAKEAISMGLGIVFLLSAYGVSRLITKE